MKTLLNKIAEMSKNSYAAYFKDAHYVIDNKEDHEHALEEIEAFKTKCRNLVK